MNHPIIQSWSMHFWIVVDVNFIYWYVMFVNSLALLIWLQNKRRKIEFFFLNKSTNSNFLIYEAFCKNSHENESLK